jgi:hypothetical protein
MVFLMAAALAEGKIPSFTKSAQAKISLTL